MNCLSSDRPRRFWAAGSRSGVAGFSLIELLVVLVIIGLLASVVGPNLLGKIGGAKAKTARVQIEELGSALDLYYLGVGDYPETNRGLAALVIEPSGVENWSGPYLKKLKIPQDPWGRDYQYKSPGEHGDYDLWSYGDDGKPGGIGEAADIASWE